VPSFFFHIPPPFLFSNKKLHILSESGVVIRIGFYTFKQLFFEKNFFVDFGMGAQPAAERADRRLSGKCEEMRFAAAI